MKPFEDIAQEEKDKLVSRVWFNLIRSHRYLYPRFERSLRQLGIENPIWYEIFLEIERAGPEGAKASDIQECLFMAQFNMSRHLSRMEKKGFISRHPDEKDGRAQILRLTPQAFNAEKEIWPQYFATIQKELGERLTKEEALELFRLLSKLYP